jgi:hypothetical protein
MKTFYVSTHMGLGDIILCNGLIRNICKIKPHVTIFCKPKYITSVTYMFRDLKNLEIVSIEDTQVHTILDNVPNNEKYFVGHGNISRLLSQNTFDVCFYKQTGLDFNRRWSDFFVERDETIENEFYEQHCPSTPFAFVHDDHSRGFYINEGLINKNYKIYRPSPTDNIFKFCKIIEKASEIHCMDSSFKHIVDSMDIKIDKLFYHIYVRGDNTAGYTQSKLNWKLIS